MDELGCRETLRELERYVDGECLKELRVQIDVHLSGCEDCSDHAEFRRHLKEFVASTCGCDQLPAGLVDRIRERIRSTPP